MKADFYVSNSSGLEWLGSLLKDGSPWYIPTDIFIQINNTMYEELVLEHLFKNNGVIKDNHDSWPHEWEDSQLTDYVYIFEPKHGKVYMCQSEYEYLIDPINIIQGNSVVESFTIFEKPEFPKMRIRIEL